MSKRPKLVAEKRTQKTAKPKAKTKPRRRAKARSRNPIVWQPDATRAQRTAMHDFMRRVGCSGYDELYDWSIADVARFWEYLADYCDVRFDTPADTTQPSPSVVPSRITLLG